MKKPVIAAIVAGITAVLGLGYYVKKKAHAALPPGSPPMDDASAIAAYFRAHPLGFSKPTPAQAQPSAPQGAAIPPPSASPSAAVAEGTAAVAQAAATAAQMAQQAASDPNSAASGAVNATSQLAQSLLAMGKS